MPLKDTINYVAIDRDHTLRRLNNYRQTASSHNTALTNFWINVLESSVEETLYIGLDQSLFNLLAEE